MSAVKPWNLAAETLVYGAAHFRALLILFAIPEIIRVGMYFAYDVAIRNRGYASWITDWTVDLFDYGISALILTGVVRYIALAEGPSWLPNSRLLLNYLATAIVMMIVASVITLITSSWFSVNFYQAFLMETPYDDQRFMKWNAVHSIAGFLLSVFLIAGIYPLFGMTAAHARIDFQRLLRWNQRYFWRFLILALLLMCVCLVVQRAYWGLFNAVSPDVAGEIPYPEVRALAVHLISGPVDFVFDLVPAIAIGLLYRVLRANSADL